MLITRETDYALRLLRGLLSGNRRTAGELAEGEQVPTQFAYKILKKLERAHLVEITRGAEGGCRLEADLGQVSLYDLMRATEEDGLVTACMKPGYTCTWREARCGGDCLAHRKLHGIQERINEELKAHSLEEILRGDGDR